MQRTVISFGAGQTAIGSNHFGGVGINAAFSSAIIDNVYIGMQIGGTAFNSTGCSTNSDTSFDILMDLSPMIGYRISKDLYLYAKAGYAFGTAGRNDHAFDGMTWGSMIHYDLTPVFTLGVGLTTGTLTVDYGGYEKKENLIQAIGYVGMKF